MKGYVIGAIAVPLAYIAGAVAIGKRGDTIGLSVLNDRGLLLPFSHGLLIELMGVGVLAAYLLKRG